MDDVLVIGAGVSGLTTAVCLAEAGWPVRIVAKEPPADTTSAAAGASWGPCMAGGEQVIAWSTYSRETFESIAVEDPGAGVRLVRGLEVDIDITTPPDWAVGLPGFDVCAPDDLPHGYTTGWWSITPLVDMPCYLDYLERRLAKVGVHVEIEALSSLADAVARAGLVVNCTGLGARELAGDAELYAVRGQVVVVRNPGVDYFFQDSGIDNDFTYFLPHGEIVVLGGSADAYDETREPDQAIAVAIIKRCAAIEPALTAPEVIDHRVGLRPGRSQVRLEIETVAGRPVIHNYGHGGSGVTLSWGCAAAVIDLARGLT